MPDRQSRVVAIIRHREAVLVCREARRSGPLSLPAAVPGGDDPVEAVYGLVDQLDVEMGAVERRGAPVFLDDTSLIPFLVAATDRAMAGGEICPEPTWVPPATLLRQADDRWWRAYMTVAPTVETVVADTERGSAAITIDALWALRDAATRATVMGEELASVRPAAEALIEARPSMAALGNRVNRAMAGAETPSEVEAAATDGIVRADEADATAARLAAETVDGDCVLTLSRAGTVRAALLTAHPEVIVLDSRPGGEGVAFATSLADAGLSVSTAPDADVYARLRSRDVDAVLVGADAVTPDGGVVNKVGTRAAALAAEWAGVPCYVVCASDKVRPAPDAGDAERPPLEQLFDWTPPRLVTALLTERGRLEPGDVLAIAEEHRALARWRE